MRMRIRVAILTILLAFSPAMSDTYAGPAAAVEGKPDVKVWVNTKNGVYHCPGSQWYGKTKEGVYMTQKEAQANGYRPAYKKMCE